jgi:hypothetical protein
LHGLEECNAAWLCGVHGGSHSEAEHGLWPCGYQKLAAMTMVWVFIVPLLQVLPAPAQDAGVEELLTGHVY